MHCLPCADSSSKLLLVMHTVVCLNSDEVPVPAGALMLKRMLMVEVLSVCMCRVYCPLGLTHK